MKLSQINKSLTVTVKEVIENHITSRLFEYGILPGATLTLVNKAPFKGPLYIRVDDSLIALRSAEADNIIVE